MAQGGTLAIAELGAVEYDRALELQTAMVAARLAGEIGDTLLLLEHPHVFTLGRGADEKFVLARRAGVPVVRVSRGGQVTYHGPGQLVGYPILKLDGAARDVTRYLRALEEVMMRALARCGIDAQRRAGLTGVWVANRKIGSIGVGIRRWVTCHGFALNVSTDLSYFDSIVPCGISGCEMTSTAELGRRDISVAAFSEMAADCFRDVFGYLAATLAASSEIWRHVDANQQSHAPEATDG
ncbi:MAG TPA: lipoyl(octanoyl) transferase LipB [Candidatus Binataceae bacterium]|nr:lipoyl(octanoyl) transferase LipB [Candidatus Binataceae bacterium]